MSHMRSFKPPVTLIHTKSGDLVRLQIPDVTTASGAGIPAELRNGEVVQCLSNDEHGVLIARGDGSRMLMPVQGARTVDIRRFSESLKGDESLDGPSHHTESVHEDGATTGAGKNRPRLPRRGLEAGDGLLHRGRERTRTKLDSYKLDS